MKIHKTNLWALAGRSSNLLSLSTIALSLLGAGQSMAQLTWTGATDALWSTSSNWTDGTNPGVPANGTALNFGGALYPNPTSFPIDNDVAGLTTGAINFNNNGEVAAAGPPVVVAQNIPFTLGKADLSQTITLGGNINTAISGSAPANSGFTDTINLNLVLNGARTISPNVSGTRTHSINAFGVISDDALGPYVLTKGGGATLGLANTANTFAGAMTITGGTLVATSLQASGTNSSIGSGSVINLAGGSLNLGNVGSTVAIAAISPINRAINFSGSGGINITAVGNVTFSGDFNNTTATNKTFTLGGDANGNIFQGVLAENGAGVLSVTKANFGSWTLTGDNTFTGLLDIPQGSLNVESISDTVGSDMGRSNLFKLGTGVQNGTLNYTGNSATTTRQLQIGFNNGTNISGGAIISANGANGGSGLKFTNADFNTTRPDSATTRPLVLGGSNTDANEISGRIIDLNTNLKIAVTKSGAGLWILSGDNTYTGTNTITGGTLQVNDSTNGLGNSTVATAIILNGGNLSLRNDGAGSNSTIIYGSTSNPAGYNVQLQSTNQVTNFTINVDNLTTNTGNTIQLGPVTQNSAFARVLNVTGGNGYRLTLPSLGLAPTTGQNTTLNPTSANLIITGNVTNPMSGFGPGNFDTLTLSGTSNGNRIDGGISDAAGSSLALGGLTRLTKSGTSTWGLNGTNTYAGITSVDNGTLLLNGNSPLTTGTVTVNGGTLGGIGTLGGAVTVTAAGSLAPGNAGLGTLTLNSSLNVAAQAAGSGKLNFELGPIATSDKIAVGGALTIGPANPAPGVLGFSDFTFSALPGLANGTYPLITGATSLVGSLDATNLTGTLGAGPAQGTLQLNGNNIELLVTGAVSDPFLAWSLGAPFDGDANNDGVENGLAWLLGASGPNVSALGLLPEVTQLPGGGLQLAFDMLPLGERDGAKLILQHSSDLGDPWASVLVPDATGGAAPVTFIVTDSDLVDPKNPLAVTATISSSEAAAGKLFGRLKAER
jgi:autotransporter-associated beta strand protein